ncbi:MAG: Adaptive-response sensory-kinase SasA [Nitrospirae bacterium]|nr:MAG: putative histidine kinase [Nitrospira sp. OLB3]MBV6471611.1 Adaptive-response sensory-kinase SasA [Nitrospirota bacterium]MCK6493852.1 ATP-binding protein [Nitrospira sp.]MEB2338705.1 ATP-binding protein [Nitrospirales bacterium]
MKILALSALVNALAAMGLGLFVFFRDPSAPRNRIYGLYCLSIAIWSVFYCGWQLSESRESAVTLLRLAMAGAILIPVLYFHHTVTFLDIAGRHAKTLRVGYAIAAGLLLTDVTPWFVAGVRPAMAFAFWPIPGPFFHPFLLYFAWYVIYATSLVGVALRDAIGIRRHQYAYMLAASIIGYVGGATNFPLWYDIHLLPYGTVLITVYTALMAYTIVRYRLMNISVVLNKGLGYAIVLAIIVVATSIGAVLSNRATAHSTPPLLAGTLFLICGLWVLSNNPRSMSNVIFSGIGAAGCLWLFGCFMLFSASREDEALLWMRVIYAGVVCLPPLTYHFAQNLVGAAAHDRLIGWNYAVGGLFFGLLFTSYVFDGQYVYYWGRYPKAGVLHPLLVMYALAGGCGTLYRLYQGYRLHAGSSPLLGAQLKYTFAAFLLGVTASLDFLQSYGIGWYPLGYLLAGLSVTVVAYAIAKYELMDVSFVPSRPKVVLSIKLMGLIPAYLVILLVIRFFTGTFHYLLAGVLFALFVIVSSGLANLQKGVERAIGQTLFRERYDAYDTLVQFSKSLVAILELKSLTKEIVQTLARVMNIKTASVYVLDKEQGLYSLAASYGFMSRESAIPSIKMDGEFPKTLLRTETALVREEIEYDRTAPEHLRLLDTLKGLESEVCIPLVSKERLVGFCNLGRRSNHSMYSTEELGLLKTLAQHASIAIDNALLYEDLRRSQLLMRRTDRLRSLETMAGGFAHEIRNPLTSIKTFVQLAPDRRDDVEFMEQFSQVVCEDVERIERLVHEILDYARYMTPKFTQENLNDVVSSCLYFIEVKASSKAITITKDLVPDLPYVKLDRQQIKQVLLNLFINAVEAIGVGHGGTLSVRTRRLAKPTNEPWVQIEVEDSGPGIEPRDLEHIFDPFYTTKHESGEREGTGLGLTIAHQIVQEHGGYFEVTSEVGHGTKFLVSLPVNPPVAEWRTAAPVYDDGRKLAGAFLARPQIGLEDQFGQSSPVIKGSSH